jgi:hypothetical protein
MKLTIDVYELPEVWDRLRVLKETVEGESAACKARLAGDGAAEAPQIPPQTPSAKPKKAKKSEKVSPATPDKDEQPELPLCAPKEDLREQLRIRCRERGVIWLRCQLELYGAERLDDLTDDQVADLLSTLDTHALAQ